MIVTLLSLFLLPLAGLLAQNLIPDVPPELVALLVDDSDAPSPVEVVDRDQKGLPLPAPLGLGDPVAVRFLMSERLPAEILERLPKDSPRRLLERYLVVTYPTTARLGDVEQALANDERIRYVRVNEPAELSGVAPSDPLFSQQWGHSSLGLPEAWDISPGHGYVAIVDTGIDTSHPDLRAFDDNGTYRGGNFASRLARDFGYDDDNVDEGETQIVGSTPRQPDRAGHGTHVAGIVGATTDNLSGVAGACQHCSLIVAKASRLRNSTFGWLNTSLSTGDIAEAITGAVDRGAQVVNLSLGQPGGACGVDCSVEPDHPTCLALEHSTLRSTSVVAAAGNGGDTVIDFPASDPRVIAVGGLTPTEQLWNDCSEPPASCFVQQGCGSNADPDQLVAPAVDILSTFHRDLPYFSEFGCGDSLLPGFPGFGPCKGTSMATPYVAGSIGLMRSINPLLTRSQIESALVSSVVMPPGWDPQHGRGKPQVDEAASAVLGVSGGSPLANRLTPLFTAYSFGAQSHFYSSAPQMMTAAYWDPEMVAVGIEGSAVPGYPQYPSEECNVSGCPDRSPKTSVYVFSTPNAPFAGAPPLVPLYRMASETPNGGNLDNRVFFYTTETLALEAGFDADYELDGREGYIFQRCTPEPSCIPQGAVRLYRLYHYGRDDFALFPEDEESYFRSQGYVSVSTLNDWIGYVYPNQDSDSDDLIDGFELLAGTDPSLPDSDCDGLWDGTEVLSFPSSDPRDGSCAGGNLSASPEVLVVPPGQLATSTITWNASELAEIWVRDNEGVERLFARNQAGSQPAPWIIRHRTYDFLLYQGLEREVLLDDVTVFGLAAGGGQISAQPRTVVVESGATSDTAEIRWATNGMSTAEVWVSRDGNAEALVARNPRNEKVVTWILPGHSYEFRLYAGTAHTTLLDAVTVVGTTP